MQVIVTRPEPDASAFAAELRAAGLTPILSPAMEIAPRAVRIDLAGIGALAFTSGNGVRAFAAVTPPPDLPVFAVGEITAAAAREAGFRNVSAAEGDVASLAANIAAARRAFSGAVLHVSGADQAGDLAGALCSEGIEASRAVLYEARPVASLSGDAARALTAEPFADWVALFSPRSVALFLQQASRNHAHLGHTRAACLSEAVAAAASGAAWAGIEIADTRNSAAMIRLMAGG